MTQCNKCIYAFPSSTNDEGYCLNNFRHKTGKTGTLNLKFDNCKHFDDTILNCPQCAYWKELKCSNLNSINYSDFVGSSDYCADCKTYIEKNNQEEIIRNNNLLTSAKR